MNHNWQDLGETNYPIQTCYQCGACRSQPDPNDPAFVYWNPAKDAAQPSQAGTQPSFTEPPCRDE